MRLGPRSPHSGRHSGFVRHIAAAVLGKPRKPRASPSSRRPRAQQHRPKAQLSCYRMDSGVCGYHFRSAPPLEVRDLLQKRRAVSPSIVRERRSFLAIA